MAGMLAVAERAASDPLIIETIRLRTLAASLIDDPEVHAALTASLNEVLQRMATSIAAGQAAGEVRTDIDPRHGRLDPVRLHPGRRARPCGARQTPRCTEFVAVAEHALPPVSRTTPRGDAVTSEHPNRKWWTLFAMCFALFMIMLDNTIVNVALPSIQQRAEDDAREPGVDGERLRRRRSRP